MRESRRSRRESGGEARGGGSRGFSYRKRSAEAFEKRKRMTGSRDYFLSNVFPLYKAAQKENCLRIMPPTWENPDHYGYDVYVHYGIGPDKAAYLCLNKMQEQPCPICEERQDAYNEGDEDYANDLRPSHGELVLIIDRDNEKEGPQVWLMPLQSIDGELLYKAKDRTSGDYLFIDDPDEGYDFYFIREGEGKQNTKYKGVDIARKSSPLGMDSQMQEWLELAVQNPLPSLLQYYDYDHIKAVFAGRAKSNKEEEDLGKEPFKSERGKGLDYNYEEIMGMEIEEVEEIALAHGFTERDLEIEDYALRKEVCEELGLEEVKTKEKEKDSEDPQERLAEMRKKYEGKRGRR